MTQTDIRMMRESLRPVAEFQSAVEQTIEALNTRREDIIVCDEEDRQEVEQLDTLAGFWASVLEGMKS